MYVNNVNNTSNISYVKKKKKASSEDQFLIDDSDTYDQIETNKIVNSQPMFNISKLNEYQDSIKEYEIYNNAEQILTTLDNFFESILRFDVNSQNYHLNNLSNYINNKRFLTKDPLLLEVLDSIILRTKVEIAKSRNK